jgi:hypothetical protein
MPLLVHQGGDHAGLVLQARFCYGICEGKVGMK